VGDERSGRVELSLERLEAGLSRWAQLSSRSRGRQIPEVECSLRTPFQRDRDRIVHSKSFRRLKHKTQVFISPEGDHYRTRLTHTLEVAGIARTISRALRLNEDLTEAIALGHDLGHTPFGHAGETVIDRMAVRLGAGRFEHNEQSARVVELLENDGQGLNLTWEVRDGIRHHSGKQPPATLEGRVVHLSDRIAYINHDIDDAIRAGLISEEALPRGPIELLGRTGSRRIDSLVHDLVDWSEDRGEIVQGPRVSEAMAELRAFLFRTVYPRSLAEAGEERVARLLTGLVEYFLDHPEALPSLPVAASDDDDVRLALVRAVVDHVAGMTDRYAQSLYMELFLPKSWGY